ncbi:MAG TPA: N-acetylglucosamine-6-phosphate deacetylase [Terriglobales bacterium]|jgi:N-acetylglucosamine-6-phosphate deacetylase|nr:N-acetylglucosamine-6-phosphate deacetylase [Terriglobales bacterium]
MLAITARALFTPLEKIEQPLVLVDEQKIVRISSQSSAEIPAGARHIDFEDSFLAPGLIDLHVHGAMGYDLMQDDEAGRAAFERFLVRHGVTSYFPTTLTASLGDSLRALERLGRAVEQAETREQEPRACPLGIHLEGPFLSHLRRGVHPPERLLTPTLDTFQRFWQASRGKIKIMTIAPELPGALEVIAEAARLGVCVSLGHSDATLEQTKAGIAAGGSHATHTFNAMRPLGHRDPGIVGEVLSNASVTADIIADGVHLHPSIVRVFLRAKGVERTVLVTDATAATGMPDGQYMLGSLEVEVRDGKCLHDGKLAGSVLTLDQAVRNAMKFAGIELQQSLRLATLNAAQAVKASRGVLEEGFPADLAVLAPSGEIRGTLASGAIVQ